LQEVYLVRHGSVYNPQNVNYGCKPGFPLSERGVREARSAAEFLADRNIEIVYHSPLERCAQTASIIADAIKVPVVESGELVDWGEDESLRDVQARINTLWMTLYAQPCERIAIVSHRDPLKALMLGLSGGKLANVYKPEVFRIEPGWVWLVRPGTDGATFENVHSPDTPAD
jgi:broad specificity phosphatase PhoE